MRNNDKSFLRYDTRKKVKIWTQINYTVHIFFYLFEIKVIFTFNLSKFLID